MSESKISYKGFTIKRSGAFYKVEKHPGFFAYLSDAKRFIDMLFDKQNKNKSNPFHY